MSSPTNPRKLYCKSPNGDIIVRSLGPLEEFEWVIIWPFLCILVSLAGGGDPGDVVGGSRCQAGAVFPAEHLKDPGS